MPNPKLQAIYDELPKMQCKGKCQECCGPILIPKIEYTQILSTGKFITGHNAAATTELNKKWNWMKLEDLIACEPERITLNCTMLSPFGRCMVYADRPLVCRVWGLTQDLRCMFGCEPEYWLTDQQVRRLFERILKVQHEEQDGKN